MGGGKERGGEGDGGDDRGRITQVDPSESEIESVQSPAARRWLAAVESAKTTVPLVCE